MAFNDVLRDRLMSHGGAGMSAARLRSIDYDVGPNTRRMLDDVAAFYASAEANLTVADRVKVCIAQLQTALEANDAGDSGAVNLFVQDAISQLRTMK